MDIMVLEKRRTRPSSLFLAGEQTRSTDIFGSVPMHNNKRRVSEGTSCRLV
jgi:hypothetical protein